MNNPDTAIQPAESRRSLSSVQASFGARGIIIGNYDELVRFADTVSKSGLAPKGLESPQSIFVAIQMGLEIGLSPMASLQNIAVVNGRPTVWGDAQLAVCRGTHELEIFEEWFEVGGKKSARNPSRYDDDTAAVCRVKRAGGQEIESAFSVADAKRANLWGKAGPWTQYPSRMLRNRARSFALRDSFGDALKGFRSTEEEQDSPPERHVTPQASESKLFATPVKAEPTALVLDSSGPSMRETFYAKVQALGVRWEQVGEVLFQNGALNDVRLTAADCEDSEVEFALAQWSQLEALVKKGGSK
jgi:hypothetical protein